MQLNPTTSTVDRWVLDLVADAVRSGCTPERAYFQVGEQVQMWHHDDPEPFEFIDELGQVAWRENR